MDFKKCKLGVWVKILKLDNTRKAFGINNRMKMMIGQSHKIIGTDGRGVFIKEFIFHPADLDDASKKLPKQESKIVHFDTTYLNI